MELTNQGKINAIKANLLSIAERSYQHKMDMQIASTNGNQEAAGQYRVMINELAVSAGVYQDELNKLEKE
jgi:hypothetical protein